VSKSLLIGAKSLAGNRREALDVQGGPRTASRAQRRTATAWAIRSGYEKKDACAALAGRLPRKGGGVRKGPRLEKAAYCPQIEPGETLARKKTSSSTGGRSPLCREKEGNDQLADRERGARGRSRRPPD